MNFHLHQKVKHRYLGTGIVVGFERFDSKGEETTAALEDYSIPLITPSGAFVERPRVIVLLDDPSKWPAAEAINQGSPYCMRHELTPLED